MTLIYYKLIIDVKVDNILLIKLIQIKILVINQIQLKINKEIHKFKKDILIIKNINKKLKKKEKYMMIIIALLKILQVFVNNKILNLKKKLFKY